VRAINQSSNLLKIARAANAVYAQSRAVLTPPPVSSAKLSDFGFAQQILENNEVGRGGGSDGDEHAGKVCGTANYIAPELLLGATGGGGAAAAADVWSLGCVMYALLFGQPPFNGKDTQQIFRRVARGTYVMPRITTG
jgi:serine/threonine protein kinase